MLRLGAENGFDILDAINSRFPVFDRVDRRRKGLPEQRKDARSVVVKRCNIRRVRYSSCYSKRLRLGVAAFLLNATVRDVKGLLIRDVEFVVTRRIFREASAARRKKRSVPSRRFFISDVDIASFFRSDRRNFVKDDAVPRKRRLKR